MYQFGGVGNPMPQIIFNLKQYTNRRKGLRNTAPPAERLLWRHLVGCQIYGLKFRRQYGIGKYTVDFYCPQIKLAIEIDGETHLTKESYDNRRQNFIESLGISVLRFLNTDVYQNIDGVVLSIQNKVTEVQATAPCPPPQISGEMR